ncbi:hypothetical protein ABIB94_009312 [Bradyrhizobium sp. JR7.2]|uniref:Uncharacterized protein n=1 Tax=Bradyrhizobium barranii TaxID=2992140 RepID=A0ABY3QZW5_9BRAD|nr:MULTISPECIES: hypothetical protein [Bradyrhizobium]TFW56025.1 hypothetical protein CT676_37650 [Bradyrhizobium sp. MOS001]UFW91566.1 hypothetical protein BjapCC829_47080 [Bradyrhizobium japonicum]WFU00077.1 hypothetical protein QA633_47855 [Bradyrhizobium barranii]CUT16329.1 hypothetical protein CDS [Bradyrhizobium sp.]
MLPALLLTFVAAQCVSLSLVQRYYSYLPFIRFEPHLLVRACVDVLPALGLVLLVARGRASFGFALSFFLLASVA